jgi:hypothetical protein
VKDHGWRGLAIGATLLAVPVGGCAVLGDDPKRTFSMPNDTGGPRLVRRCDDEFDCRSPHRGELVQPGESLDFKLYFDEDRTYVVGDAEGKTLGCLRRAPGRRQLFPGHALRPGTVPTGHAQDIRIVNLLPLRPFPAGRGSC